VKKLTRLPSGSRNNRDRLPHGIVVGSLTKSMDKLMDSCLIRSYSLSTSSTRNSMIAVWLSAGPGRARAEERHRAGAADREGSGGGGELDEVRRQPPDGGAGDLRVELGEAGDVVADDPDRHEVRRTGCGGVGGHDLNARSNTGQNPPGIGAILLR